MPDDLYPYPVPDPGGYDPTQGMGMPMPALAPGPAPTAPNFLGLPWRKPRVPGMPVLQNPAIMDGAQGLTGQGPLQDSMQAPGPQAPPASAQIASNNIQPAAPPPQPRLQPSPQAQPMQPPSPAQITSPDPYIQRLTGLMQRSLPQAAPQMPAPPTGARAVIGGLLGAKHPALGQLIEYGPKGMGQMQQVAQFEKMLPQAVAAGQLSSQDLERRIRAGELVEAQKTREQKAYDDEVKTITATQGGEQHDPTDPVAPNWTRRTIRNPTTGESETYHIPSAGELAKLKKQAQLDAARADWIKFDSDTLKKYPALPTEGLPPAQFTDLLKEFYKAPPASQTPLGDRVTQLNQAMASRYRVLHPNVQLPPQYTLPPNATKEDFDQLDKVMEAEERAAGTKAQQETTNAMRQQTLALAQAAFAQRTDAATRKAAYTAFTPAMDSAERLNVMTQNYEDAIKNHDQQAMLSLLANHLGMTMGLQKGARMNQAIISEAMKSRPWLQGLKSQFDKDGYLTGVTLTPTQMRQMVDLGRTRFSEDVKKSRGEAQYMGATDDGPDRIPGKATMNHYLALTNGDVARAKQLAAQDGWTVR